MRQIDDIHLDGAHLAIRPQQVLDAGFDEVVAAQVIAESPILIGEHQLGSGSVEVHA